MTHHLETCTVQPLTMGLVGVRWAEGALCRPTDSCLCCIRAGKRVLTIDQRHDQHFEPGFR